MGKETVNMPARTISAFCADVADTQWSRVTPIDQASPWLRASQRQISELAQLADNWDSYGSPPLQPAAIEHASEALDCLSTLQLPSPQIFPVPGGGIQLEFEKDRRELQIEFLPDGSIEYLKIASNGEMLEGSIPLSKGELRCLAYWLQGKLEDFPF